MKLLVMSVILLAAMPLFGQPQIIVDNRTSGDIDTARLERLAYQALLHSTGNRIEIVLHLWSKKDVRSKNDRKMESFFAGPNQIYLSKMDYLCFVQGVLLAAFPKVSVDELESKSRRIFLEEQLVFNISRISNERRAR